MFLRSSGTLLLKASYPMLDTFKLLIWFSHLFDQDVVAHRINLISCFTRCFATALCRRMSHSFWNMNHWIQLTNFDRFLTRPITVVSYHNIIPYFRVFKITGWFLGLLDLVTIGVYPCLVVLMLFECHSCKWPFVLLLHSSLLTLIVIKKTAVPSGF